ncbi:hypothetical protein COO91_01678 [Nostoc flagelliforme CCNUN1]|uniref:Uncharacterized protein n=1 Tax=Nostoc flagelliforme CCNUN1 TaxID=2038116 RepID=A0A2K8SK37_9NOSO|nr:hypothetical protein COO91_01678 [Nostoc flagelliforme CCNUN1]
MSASLLIKPEEPHPRQSSPFKVTGKIRLFFSALSVPLRFKSDLFNLTRR